MAVASSYREASCLVRQRSRPAVLFASMPFGVYGYNKTTASAKLEEGAGYGRSACPESSGIHAGYNGQDKRYRPRKSEVIHKPDLSPDRRLQLAFVKMESVVIVTQNVTVNMSLLLAHTARQTTRVGSGGGRSL